MSKKEINFQDWLDEWELECSPVTSNHIEAISARIDRINPFYKSCVFAANIRQLMMYLQSSQLVEEAVPPCLTGERANQFLTILKNSAVPEDVRRNCFSGALNNYLKTVIRPKLTACVNQILQDAAVRLLANKISNIPESDSFAFCYMAQDLLIKLEDDQRYLYFTAHRNNKIVRKTLKQLHFERIGLGRVWQCQNTITLKELAIKVSGRIASAFSQASLETARYSKEYLEATIMLTNLPK